ncbi:MAG: NAD(P)H-hydrate epimerase, partial [Methanosarcinales archaeon]|nr:NAD(P)H-hydrate epimerase [Methanosarcinales archaeon]
MKIEITPSEMHRIDRNCVDLGLFPLQLMENAGAYVARVVRARFDRGTVIILAGTGNNGGDGFVAARHLLDYDPEILILGRARDIATDEARQNWQILKNLDANISEIRDSSELPDSELDADVIIDAMLGTGVHGRVREPTASA